MIIFGTRGLTLTGKPHPFFCPHCDTERSYKRKTIRRFFTLYFIPLIPLRTIGEYIECGSCRGTYKPEVLKLSLPRAT